MLAHVRLLHSRSGRDPLIDVALALEQAARSDEYFLKRKLYPNVDFFSGALVGLAAGLSGGGAACLDKAGELS